MCQFLKHDKEPQTEMEKKLTSDDNHHRATEKMAGPIDDLLVDLTLTLLVDLTFTFQHCQQSI